MRKLSAVGAAGLMAVGMVVGLAASRATAGHQDTHVPRAQAARAVAYIEQSLDNRVPYMQGVRTLASDGPLSEVGSYNWSGFSDAGTEQALVACTSRSDGCQSVSQVAASWEVPKVTCPPAPFEYEDQDVAQWVGIDGVNDTTVEQVGSISYCFEGDPYYVVWYELYPGASVVEGPTSCLDNDQGCPQPGDRVSASVTAAPSGPGEDAYTLALTDPSTPGNSFTVTQDCATDVCFDDSASWVVERPDYPTTGFTPLGDFGTTAFTDATVTAFGRQTGIQGYAGDVFDTAMVDSTASYFLDCVGQATAPGLLTLAASSSSPNPCPAVEPSGGDSYGTTSQGTAGPQGYGQQGNGQQGNGQQGNGQPGNGQPGGRGYYPPNGSAFNVTWDVAF